MANHTPVGSTQPEIFTPPGAPNGGVIVIAHGSDGLTDNARGPWATMMREYAVALAQKGFVASIPDYFAMTQSAPPASPEDILKGRDRWQKALTETVNEAKVLAGVDAQRVGLLGFSLGGHLCLRLRASSKALVAFFAPQLDLAPIGALKLQAQLHHGEADTLVTFKPNAGNILEILKKDKANAELWPYPGAGHGFVGADSSNTKARTDSKARTVAFFSKNL